MVGMGLMMGGGLFVLSIVIMLVVFGNRMSMAFVIDDRGVNARIVDRRARIANRLAAVVGGLAGRPGAAGAGLIAMSNEETGTVWSGVASASYDSRRRTITLRNDWRPVIHVFCTPETYEEAAGRIADGLAGVRRRGRRGRNPLWPTLAWTVVVVLSVLPLFDMPYPFEPHLFSIIFVLCFAVATVWLVPLMGWPVLGGVAWIAATLALQGLRAPHQPVLGQQLHRLRHPGCRGVDRVRHCLHRPGRSRRHRPGGASRTPGVAADARHAEDGRRR